MLMMRNAQYISIKERICPVVMRMRETPVPIPNTTVKTHPADDTRALGSGKAGGCRAFFFIDKEA